MADQKHTYQQDNTVTPGTQLAHTLVGSPYLGGVGQQRENAGPGTGIATAWSTAPYKKPVVKQEQFVVEPSQIRKNANGKPYCQDKDNTCKGYAQAGSAYCPGHNKRRAA